MQNGAPQASTSRSTQETEQTAGSGPVSYQRASSGRPKLTLSPPLAEHEQQYPLFQGIYHPSQPNRESDVTQPQSNVAQKQTLNSAAQKTAEMQWEPDTPRWWTFTLPAEAMKKVDAYWHAKEQQRHSSDSSDSSDSQQQQQPPPGTAGHGEHLLSEKKQQPQPDSSPTPPHTAQSFSAKIGGAFAGHSGSSTPWMAPWTPFRAPSNHNIERGLQDPDSLESHAQRNKKPAGLWGRIQNFLLFSAFAPFWLRFINLAFTATVLGLAAKIHQSQQSAGFGGLIGASTVMILVIGPLSIVHIFGALFFEYFGAPVGVASVGTKMMYTLLDLLFVALWSAVLAVTFDDFFTSTAQCTSWTPYRRWRGDVFFNLSDVPGQVCDLQLSLLVLNFLSVLLYQAVLIVSLFRIFKKVSRPAR